MVAGQIRDAAKRREPIALLCRHDVADRCLALCVAPSSMAVASLFLETLNQALIETYVRTVRIEITCCAFSFAK